MNLVSRNAGAQWFFPTESEWYKAAYHQPAAQGGAADNYWGYPTRTKSVLYSDQPPGATPDNTHVGNFYQHDGLANGYDDGYAVAGSISLTSSQNYLSDAGTYTSSPTFYDTFDQGGNVWEWNEARLGASLRGLRGGWWHSSSSFLPAVSRSLSGGPTREDGSVGFRVATVPEPSTLLLAALAAAGLLLRRRVGESRGRTGTLIFANPRSSGLAPMSVD